MSTPPTPERIFGTLTAYQTCAALSAAIHLRVFTHIAAGKDTLPALARETGASERGLRALANHLVAREFLQKDGERYRCAPDAGTFLDESQPTYMGSVTTFLNNTALVRSFEGLDQTVRHGGTRVDEGGATSKENPLWVDFARAMQPMAASMAATLVQAVCARGVPQRVLDIAAGHGLYGLGVAQRSETSEVVFQDWKNVLAVARENAERAGLGSRVSFLPGSAFEVELGTGFDAILVTNFLHHFEREQCVRFLARCRAALALGGRVAVLEFVLEDDRVTPPQSAAFDLVMLATTPHGEAYTLSEFGAMFADAGLEKPVRSDVPGLSHTVLVAGAAS